MSETEPPLNNLGRRRSEQRRKELCQNPGQDMAYDKMDELVNHSVLILFGA